MTLAELLTLVPTARVIGDETVSVRTVQSDSRKVQAGDAFATLLDPYRDGREYIAHAIEAGAVAIITHEAPAETLSVPVVVVPQVASALAHFSAAIHDNPSRKLQLVGITGTNGKTSTAMMLEAILATARKRPGLFGTAVGARYAGKVIDTGLTTPEAPELQAVLADMVASEVQVAVMEVSSHGIGLRRVDGCDFAVGVFTGLGQDHLDYHGSIEEYGETKINWLLGEVQQSRGNLGVVVPADDDWGQEVYSEYRGDILTFGFDEEADIHPTALELSATGTRGRITTPSGTLTLNLQVAGRHNVRNAMAAIGAAQLLGIEAIDIVEGLGRVRAIPGRFQPVVNDKGLQVLVDYAHTPDALESALASIRELTEGRTIAVFGCGGDRDKAKRPDMARVVYAGADVMVVTSDNPRSEDPHQIIEDILLGVPVDADPQKIVVEADREAAIGIALSRANAGDVVLIAGKGHESGQIIGDEKRPFDDSEVAARLMGGSAA